jgi:hypothetical protein
MGEECGQLLVPLKMFKWSEKPVNGFQFYPDRESMLYAYSDGSAKIYRKYLNEKIPEL